MVSVEDCTHGVQQSLVVVQVLFTINFVEAESLSDVLIVSHDIAVRQLDEHVVEHFLGFRVSAFQASHLLRHRLTSLLLVTLEQLLLLLIRLHVLLLLLIVDHVVMVGLGALHAHILLMNLMLLAVLIVSLLVLGDGRLVVEHFNLGLLDG